MNEFPDPKGNLLDSLTAILADAVDVFDFPTRMLTRSIFSAVTEIRRCAIARWELDSKMDCVNRSYNQVRNELCDVGLLADELYLDSIELEISLLPNYGEVGYFFESVPLHYRLLGYREGVIYLPGDIPDLNGYMPGGSLINTIRHEYAHAWHWMEPEFFDRPWYEKAFSIPYDDVESVPLQAWIERKRGNRDFRKAIKACLTENQAANLLNRELRNDFVSEYAATLSREDFAETFMLYLKHRNNLDKFRARTGVHKKLRAVERAVKTARLELGL